jgi:outer membrane protein assembly factor BamB
MAAQGERQRVGRVIVWINVVLAVAILAFVGYRFLDRGHFESDPERLAKLRDAPLHPPEDASLPGAWPQWRGPHRDGVSMETGLLTRWPKTGPKVVWKVPCGGGYSSLAVAGGKVYTLFQDGDNETVGCWEAATGKVLWKYPYACNYQNDYGSGPRATPTVDGDYVYTVGATGLFHCLKAATGEKVWGHDLLGEFQAENLRWGVSFSPLIDDDRIFTNPGGPNGNSLAGFDKGDGKLIWKALDDPAGYSSPIISTAAGVRQVVFFTGKHLVSVSPADGKRLWSYPWETSYDCNIATPIARGDYVFISSGYDKGCALLEISRSTEGSLQAKPVYQHNRMRNHFSSSVLYKDHLFGFDDATLVCMDFRTGKIVWKEKGFHKGSLLVADGRLIILGEKGKLALAEATPDQYREQAAFAVSPRQCWTVPVLADGKLYVRDEQEIVCLDLKQP